VLAYDLEAGDDGAALVAYRDDDVPSGASGGSVRVVLARLGGIGEPKLVSDEGVGTGVPDLLPGWIAVSGVTGSKQLAPMNGVGDLLAPLSPERSLGAGELLAASGDRLLLATPTGRAMRLSVVRCAADATPPSFVDGGAKGDVGAPSDSASAH
jgi:hypothetical protein